MLEDKKMMYKYDGSNAIGLYLEKGYVEVIPGQEIELEEAPNKHFKLIGKEKKDPKKTEIKKEVSE